MQQQMAEREALSQDVADTAQAAQAIRMVNK
jgi:hypothetical protein